MAAFVFAAIFIVVVGLLFASRMGRVQKAKSATFDTIDGFEPTIRFDGILGGNGVAIDPRTNRFAISGVGVAPKVYVLDQLMSVEVSRDGSAITSTETSEGFAAAAIGAALVGPAGLLLGANSRSRGITQNTVNKLSLKLYLSDLVEPSVEVLFYRNPRGGHLNSGTVHNAINRLDEWYGRFRVLLTLKSGHKSDAEK